MDIHGTQGGLIFGEIGRSTEGLRMDPADFLLFRRVQLLGLCWIDAEPMSDSGFFFFNFGQFNRSPSRLLSSHAQETSHPVCREQAHWPCVTERVAPSHRVMSMRWSGFI